MKIAIDAGHWINEPGRRCWKQFDPEEHREWWLNSRIIEKVAFQLDKYDVEYIRLDDPTGKTLVGLGDRVAKADAFGADILVSVHHNGSIKGGSGGGTVAYTDNDKRNTISFEYAKALYNEVVSRTELVGNRSAKVTTKSLAVCRTKCPAVLLENGFMDSSTDVPIIITEEHAEKTAAGIVTFLVNTFGLKEKAPQPKETRYIAEVIAEDFLNLRAKPNNNGKIITPLLPNSFVLVTNEAANGWLYCKTPNGLEGYIYSKYVEKFTEVDFPRKKVADATGLNIRSDASTKGAIIATMPDQAVFMVLEKSKTWGTVWCGDTIGFANITDRYSKPL